MFFVTTIHNAIILFFLIEFWHKCLLKLNKIHEIQYFEKVLLSLLQNSLNCYHPNASNSLKFTSSQKIFPLSNGFSDELFFSPTDSSSGNCCCSDLALHKNSFSELSKHFNSRHESFLVFAFFFLYLSESILLLAHELYEDPEILWNETILFAASPLSERGNFLIVEILLGPILITGKITLGFGCVFHYELLWAFPQFPLFLAHSLNSNAVTWCWGLERKGTKWNKW